MNTTVKDVMTTRVIWVKKDATFREMAATLRGPFPARSGLVPVVLLMFILAILSKHSQCAPGASSPGHAKHPAGR